MENDEALDLLYEETLRYLENDEEASDLMEDPDFVQALCGVGFSVNGFGLASFHRGGMNVTIEACISLPGGIYISWDERVDADDAQEFTNMILQSQKDTVAAIPEAVISFVRSHLDKENAAGFDTSSRNSDASLPEELKKVEGARVEVTAGLAKKMKIDVVALEAKLKQRSPLLIQSWGREHRNAAPVGSQCNFNACVLNAKGGEADASTMNGTYEEMQRKLIQGPNFIEWMIQAIEKIERLDLHNISVNCAHGRHRSVAAAEVLRKWIYPKAEHFLCETQRVRNEKAWTGKPSKA